MKGWFLVLLFVAGCSPQYTREQDKNCNAAWLAAYTFDRAIVVDTPAHTRETVLAALPALIDRLKSYPPGSTGADEEVAGLLQGLIVLRDKVPRLGESVTTKEIDDLLSGFSLWFTALNRRCQEIDQRFAAPSVASPAPFPAG
jgi:hypothetical protein